MNIFIIIICFKLLDFYGLMIRSIPARKSSLSMIKWSTSFQWTAISLQSLWRCRVFSVCVSFQLVAVCDSLTCICVFCVNQWLSPLFLCLWLEITSCSVRLWAIRDQQCPQILFILFFFHQTSTSSKKPTTHNVHCSFTACKSPTCSQRNGGFAC